MSVVHAQKRGTKNKTKCGQWMGQLPRGEYVAASPAQVTCPGCK